MSLEELRDLEELIGLEEVTDLEEATTQNNTREHYPIQQYNTKQENTIYKHIMHAYTQPN